MKTTFDLPDELVRKAKALAAQQGRPLRNLVAEAIAEKLAAAVAREAEATEAHEVRREHVNTGAAYEDARRQFFASAPQALGAGGAPLPSREEVHDRASSR